MQLQIDDNKFEGNKAITLPEQEDMSLYRIGGAILYNCYDENDRVSSDCNVSLSRNLFVNNSALDGSGAMQWAHVNFT